MRKPEVSIADAQASLDNDLLALIKSSLRVNTRSFSPHRGKTTGNAYQEVSLRGEQIAGFRQSDPHLYAGMDLAGLSLVDLGCNVGEKTRLAAARGAGYAEGVEYEQFFVTIGNLISAYNRSEGVTIRQGDITRPGVLTRDFDIGASFSSFTYVKQNLADIASRIKRQFILETHAMGESWFRTYVLPTREHFPHWVFLGFTDQSAVSDERRGLLLFSRKHAEVVDVPTARSDSLDVTHPDVAWIDLEHSARARTMFGRSDATKRLFNDLRTELAALSRPNSDRVFEIIETYAGRLGALDLSGPRSMRFSSDLYWQKLLAGMVDHVKRGEFRGDNPYVTYMMEISSADGYDVGLKSSLATAEGAVERMGPRIDALLQALRSASLTHPLLAFNLVPFSSFTERQRPELGGPWAQHLAVDGHGEYYFQKFDGHHRLAMLWLSGAAKCPILPVWTNAFDLAAVNLPVTVPGVTTLSPIDRLFEYSIYGFGHQGAAAADTKQAVGSDPD